MLKKEKAITLIALVITIIILLILAGVTISALSGDNGILQNATKAKEETEKAEAKEKVQLEVINSYDEAGQFDMDKFKENLKNNLGLQDEDIKDNGDGSITVTVDGYEITVGSNGNVKLEESTSIGKIDGSYDTIKGVNTPKIDTKNGMKLVVYKDGEWIEDTTKSAYSYKEQTGTTEKRGTSEWANAEVEIEGVKSYFVWIPRYAYKITYNNPDDKTQGGTIDVKFLIGKTDQYYDDKGNIQTAKRINSVDEEVDTTTNYYVHPAFTTIAELGGGWKEELSGLWIGKYESSLVNKNDSSNYINTTDATIGDILLSNSEHTGKAIAIQPNKSSWRCCTIENMYANALAYSTNLQSHMLKNSEWGAVAYLTHSKYGRNGTEVTINNNKNFLTGNAGDSVSASSSDTTNAYNTSNGVLASSTGNVYGIYDLSGGAYEYVTGGYSNQSKIGTIDGSNEYGTVYNGTTDSSIYIYGDATYETKKWFNDYAGFVNSNSIFFVRGGGYSDSLAGLFYFFSDNGYVNSYNGFRVCLAVQ